MASTEQSSSAALDSLNLEQVNGRPPEPSRKLVAIKELSLGGLDGAELAARGASNEADALAQRAVLLCRVAVAAEGAVGVAAGILAETLRQGAGWGGWVWLWAVVQLGRNLVALADKSDQRHTLGGVCCLAQSSCCKHCGVLVSFEVKTERVWVVTEVMCNATASWRSR